MIYTHVLQRGACGVQSPLDRLVAMTDLNNTTTDFS